MKTTIPITWLEPVEAPMWGNYDPESMDGRLRVAISGLMPGSPVGVVLTSRSEQNAVYRVAKRIGAKVTTRKMEQGGWQLRRTA